MNEFYLTHDASPTSSDVFFKIKLIFFYLISNKWNKLMHRPAMHYDISEN